MKNVISLMAIVEAADNGMLQSCSNVKLQLNN